MSLLGNKAEGLELQLRTLQPQMGTISKDVVSLTARTLQSFEAVSVDLKGLQLTVENDSKQLVNVQILSKRADQLNLEMNSLKVLVEQSAQRLDSVAEDLVTIVVRESAKEALLLVQELESRFEDKILDLQRIFTSSNLCTLTSGCGNLGDPLPPSSGSPSPSGPQPAVLAPRHLQGSQGAAAVGLESPNLGPSRISFWQCWSSWSTW